MCRKTSSKMLCSVADVTGSNDTSICSTKSTTAVTNCKIPQAKKATDQQGEHDSTYCYNVPKSAIESTQTNPMVVPNEERPKHEPVEFATAIDDHPKRMADEPAAEPMVKVPVSSVFDDDDDLNVILNEIVRQHSCHSPLDGDMDSPRTTRHASPHFSTISINTLTDHNQANSRSKRNDIKLQVGTTVDLSFCLKDSTSLHLFCQCPAIIISSDEQPASHAADMYLSYVNFALGGIATCYMCDMSNQCTFHARYNLEGGQLSLDMLQRLVSLTLNQVNTYYRGLLDVVLNHQDPRSAFQGCLRKIQSSNLSRDEGTY